MYCYGYCNTTCAKLAFFTQLTEEVEIPDQHKSAGLGKKMKAISLTMRRKMGKKHAKTFSEEAVSHWKIDTHTTHTDSRTHSLPFYLIAISNNGLSFHHPHILISDTRGEITADVPQLQQTCVVFLRTFISFISYKPTSSALTPLHAEEYLVVWL